MKQLHVKKLNQKGNSKHPKKIQKKQKPAPSTMYRLFFSTYMLQGEN